MKIYKFLKEILRSILRKIYYYIFSFLLNLLAYLFFWIRPKKIDTENVKKILLIKLERIGDLILSTPAIREVRKYFPKSHISIVVSPYTKEILKVGLGMDAILEYDSKSSLVNKVNFIRNLRHQNIDLAIDLNTRNFSFNCVWLLFLSKAKITLGLNNFGRGFLYNNKVKPQKKIQLYAKEVIHIVSHLGIKTDNYNPKLTLPKGSENFINNYFRSNFIDSKDKVIVIHPGGYYKALRWGKHEYAQVIKHVIEKYQAKIFLIGIEKEKGWNEEIISFLSAPNKPINAAGIFHLNQTMALISKSQLFIGNSSGPLHIACGFNIPTISFLGPSIPERWTPQGENNIVFRGKLTEGFEIEYGQNKDYKELKPVEVSSVIKAIDQQLKMLKNE